MATSRHSAPRAASARGQPRSAKTAAAVAKRPARTATKPVSAVAVRRAASARRAPPAVATPVTTPVAAATKVAAAAPVAAVTVTAAALPVAATPVLQSGRITLGTSLSIREVTACARELRAGLADGARELDVGALENIDTAGVQLLLATLRTAHGAGMPLQLLGAQGLVLGAAAALGLGDAFAVCMEAA